MQQQKKMPNIMIWSWMRTVLGLCGMELTLFSYVFSKSYDGIHKCYTSLTEMEGWFGITRQTISRLLDKISTKGYITKGCEPDSENPILKHNSYYVNIDRVTKLCEEFGDDEYKEFLASYGTMLKQRFPEEGITIDTYLNELLEWHENKNMKITITLNQLASVIHSGDVDEPSISEMIKRINNTNSIKKNPERNYIEKSQPIKQKEQSPPKLFEQPKRKSRRTKQNEWDVEKRSMNTSFVTLRLGGNEELLQALNNFLDTDNGRSYTPVQWEQQLENMYKYGRTVQRMIDGVNFSFMNNYRSLYYVDKSEVDINLKLDEIERYVHREAEDNQELKQLLINYVTEVPKGKSYTHNQFVLSLENLSNLCPTTESKIESVRNSYANSYASLAYPTSTSNTNNKSTNSTDPVDVEKKHDKIKQFIVSGYYQLCEGLEELLMTYVDSTTSGSTMSYQDFCIVLDNLRLFCLKDEDKIAKIKLAIQNNSKKLATENFEETSALKKRMETREGVASHRDRSRKAEVEKFKRLNPNDPRVADIVLPTKKSHYV